jgi:ribonucleoside-diphosphate reductase beta chain
MIKPLLGPCDSYQLEPFAYLWAWEMSRAQENNNWAPEEIQVGPDVADYKNPDLDPKHKHLFESVMAQLTTFDILRGDEIAECLQPIFQPAEIKHFLKRMAWDEALHTRSYRFVIENLGIPLEIYTRYQTVPEFKARVVMCDEISKPLFKLLSLVYDEDDGFDMIALHHKQNILRSMIFYFLIFEGTWFWISLMGPIQQLSRLGVFKGAAEQFTYIARDEQQHVGFGIQLIREFMGQYPECLTKGFLEQVYSDVDQAIKLEADYISHCLKDGPILGYSSFDHVSTAKYFANLRLGSVGLAALFPDAYHAFPWMSEAMELRKEKNFFETRVTEYQASGALSFDDCCPNHDQPGWSDPLA